MCQLSGPEAHRRVQTARLHEALPDWATAQADGDVGVAQSELMARIAANPRIASAVLERDSTLLLDDAVSCSFDEFERRARTWEALADPAGDLAKRTQDQRHADALVAMARAAASTPPGSQQPRPTLNVLIDQESFEAHLCGETPDPRRYRDVVVRTQSGHRLRPARGLVRRRPLPRLESPRQHRPPKRPTPLPSPQPPQRTRLPGLPRQ
jgi:hypothetical protein